MTELRQSLIEELRFARSFSYVPTGSTTSDYVLQGAIP
jgi:hypothetical protein